MFWFKCSIDNKLLETLRGSGCENPLLDFRNTEWVINNKVFWLDVFTWGFFFFLMLYGIIL